MPRGSSPVNTGRSLVLPVRRTIGYCMAVENDLPTFVSPENIGLLRTNRKTFVNFAAFRRNAMACVKFDNFTLSAGPSAATL